jgi:hypothetical protein
MLGGLPPGTGSIRAERKNSPFELNVFTRALALSVATIVPRGPAHSRIEENSPNSPGP